MLERKVGVGLRPPHYPHLLESPRTGVGWFEAISENYMDSQGRPRDVLDAIRRDYPVALHGVSLSIGRRPPPGDPASVELHERRRSDYLSRLSRLVERIEPFLVSDHLCWTGVPDRNLHDLFPLPLDDDSLDWVTRELDRVQTALGRTFVLEHVSSYLTYRDSTYAEWEFLVELARRSGCRILFDINNVYVSARNHGYDPAVFVDAIPADIVAQIHLAGHTDLGTHLFDTHSTTVCDDVWALFRRAVVRMPDVPVLVEWDEDIPEFSVLEAEALKAEAVRSQSLGDAAAVGAG